MILASGSPRRRELLLELGFDLDVRPANIDEARRAGESPVNLVGRLAREKAEAARASLGAVPADGLLLAADTVVWTRDDVLGKPRDEDAAVRMLLELAGRTHQVSTGVCALLLEPDGSVKGAHAFVETTEVEFWPLTVDEAKAYAASGEPLDKAGGYGIQGLGRLLVKEIRGDYYNVVGLPVSRLVRELADLTGDRRMTRRALEGGRHD